jgi:hypothetical protein
MNRLPYGQTSNSIWCGPTAAPSRMLLDRGFDRRLALRRHPAGRLLDTLLDVLKCHAGSKRDLGLRQVEERLSKHWYLRRVRHVEDCKDRALSVLNKLIEGFRLEDLLHPIDCLDHPAPTKDFVTSIGVDDSFEHHSHNNLQMGPAPGVRSPEVRPAGSSRRSTPGRVNADASEARVPTDSAVRPDRQCRTTQMMGHKSATMTLDLYGHLFPDRLDVVAEALDAATVKACATDEGL